MFPRLRSATTLDLPRIHEVRHGTAENRLDDPSLVTPAEVEWYLNEAIFLVSEDEAAIQGFTCANHQTGYVWALFVIDGAQGRGHGTALLNEAIERFRQAGHRQAFLTTGKDTKAGRPSIVQGGGCKQASRGAVRRFSVYGFNDWRSGSIACKSRAFSFTGQPPDFRLEFSSMAVPRRKTSPSRRGMRRSADALKAPTYVEDKDSGELRRPHHIDLKTGMYRGRQVLKPKSKTVDA